MQAVVFAAYGGPDVLETRAVPRPLPGPGQVRVRVRAAGVQPADAKLRAGRPAGRAWPLPVRFPQMLGNEFAGAIDRLGPGADEFAVGDEVLGWAVLSCYAEYVVVSPAQIVAKPPAMPWAVAGALSASGQTAYAALQALNVGRGDTLLIHAAAGGVGSAAVQLARRHGATVIGTASAANHDYLRGLGATPVAYGPGLVERVRALAPLGIDAALDAIGDEALVASVALGIDRGRIGTLADPAAAERLGVRSLRTRRSLACLNELVELHGSGALDVTVRRTYALHEAAAAHRELDSGHGRGKLVLLID
ncbi:MAG: NADP-dependent oxidoreductase [Solimonas sp.]